MRTKLLISLILILVSLFIISPIFSFKKGNLYIKKVKKLIELKQYKQAKKYLIRININNFKTSDQAILSYYAGHVYSILAFKDYNDHYYAAYYFMKAYRLFRKPYWKALCSLNLGILYYHFYNKDDKSKLDRGLYWLNKVNKKYSYSPYYNDSLFYQCLIYKKLKLKKKYLRSFKKIKSKSFKDDKIYWKDQYISKKEAIEKFLGNYR